MLVVLFRSRLAPEAGADYHAMADEMLERARAMPGFVDFTHYAAPDGERLAVVRWQDECRSTHSECAVEYDASRSRAEWSRNISHEDR